MTRSEKLLDKLESYCPGAVPMHMPGHKRNTELAPYLKTLGAAVDITEIDSFDNLHDSEGILARSMERAAGLWGAKRSFFGVNGSTGGLLAAVFTLLQDGDEVICARNCHKAVYNALKLRRAKVRYLFPTLDSFCGTASIVTPEQVSRLICQYPGAKAVILTSPSYEGIISDIAGIARVVHEAGLSLLVDEAHGAHLGFGGIFPSGAVAAGADIVVQSLHKTLPCLTQTAIVHTNGDRVDPDELGRNMAVFETSSPSYVLMASMDGCIDLLETRKEELFSAWSNMLTRFRADVSGLQRLKLMERSAEMFEYDPGKLVISTRGTNLSGSELMLRLRALGIETEMAAVDYVIAMTGMGDRPKHLNRLARALLEIDRSIDAAAPNAAVPAPEPIGFCQSWEAERFATEAVSPENSVGRVCAEYLWAYPPGIPLIVPGEVIDRPLLQTVSAVETAGIHIKSTRNSLPEKIYVLKTADET